MMKLAGIKAWVLGHALQLAMAGFLVLSAYAGWQTLKVAKLEGSIVGLEERLDRVREQRENAIQAAEQNLINVRTIRSDLSSCIADRAADLEAAAAEAEAARRDRDTIADALARERAARRQIYDDDSDCDAWRRAAVCPAIERRMRESRTRARGSDPD